MPVAMHKRNVGGSGGGIERLGETDTVPKRLQPRMAWHGTCYLSRRILFRYSKRAFQVEIRSVENVGMLRRAGHRRLQQLTSLPLGTPVSCSFSSRRADVSSAAVAQKGFYESGSYNAEALKNELKIAMGNADISGCLAILKSMSMADPGKAFRMSSRDMRRLIGLALDRGNPEQAIDLVMALPKVGPKQFSVLMGECLQRKNTKALHLALEARKAAGLSPDAYTATAELKALGSTARSNEIMDVLRRIWKDPKCRKVEVCNAAINSCAMLGDWDGASDAMVLLRSTKALAPDVITYNSLIKAAGAAKMMDKARATYEELLESNIQANTSTYCLLFSAAARNKYSDASWLLSVFEEMPIRANDFVLSSFFTAISVSRKCSRQELEVVFRALENTRGYGPVNDHTYAALLSLITRQGIPSRTIDVWTAALQDGIPLSPHIFSSLFSACAAGSSPALVDLALDAYHEMRDWWGAQDKRRVAPWIKRDALVAYNALLNFIGHAGYVEEVLIVLEDMKSEGPVPDVVTYNTAISVVGKTGDAETAKLLFDEMLQFGIKPTERTFGAILNACAKVGDAQSAKTIFNRIEKFGIKPNVVIYTSFIDALIRNGEEASLSLAFQVADDMRNLGLFPSEVTYGCLLNGCEKIGDVPRAFALYKQACAEGILPSDEMHNILINVCTRNGKLDEALDLVKSTARAHAKLQQHTIDSLVRALSLNSPGRALRMLSLMQTMNMAPSSATYLALITACAKSSDVMEALTLYRSMKAQGMELDGASGSALIMCLCRVGDLSQAVQVYVDMMALAWRPQGRYCSEQLSENDDRGFRNIDDNDTTSRPNFLTKRAQVPSAAALASLTQAFAECCQLNEAWRFYKQLRRMTHGFQDATVSHRRMFEVLIEENCRQKNIDRSLIVFDDWKAASSSWYARPKASVSSEASKIPAVSSELVEGNQAGSTRRHPRLSNVTLAFLESCCRNGDPSLSWRVYDVCAVMRLQKERKVQENLARPQKASHHVLGKVAKLG